jgi:hypothetical protein
MEEVRRQGGSNKINLREFRERMIANGFTKPRFFVRANEVSPKPVSKLHERLYKEKDDRKKLLEQKRR